MFEHVQTYCISIPESPYCNMHNGVKTCMKSNPNIYDPTGKNREIYLSYLCLQQFDKFLI